MHTTSNPMKLAATDRVHYFPRQLITADDMTAEQEYFREKLRRHNRYLHGWGVVCGCAVEPYPDAGHPWQVRICPGYIITPQGDEILIAEPVNFDMGGDSRQLPDPCANPSPCPPVSVMQPKQERQKVYLAACYAECNTRPVRVHPVGCACDESACDYSRIRDSFELVRLTDYPQSHRMASQVQLGPAGSCCPSCYDDSCVVLAAIRLPLLRAIPIALGDISYSGFSGNDGRRQLLSVAQLPTPPMVISTSPGNQGTGVPIDQVISVTFDHVMDAATIDSTTITVSLGGGTVNGQWAYDATNKLATFKPQSTPLTPGKYTVTVTHSVKDVCGDPIPGNFSWCFVVIPPIKGEVVKTSGAKVANAGISLLDSSGNSVMSSMSDATGQYLLTGTGLLTTGATYTVKVVNYPAGFSNSSPASQTLTWQGTEITLNDFVLS